MSTSPLGAECLDERAGLGVQTNQPVAGSYIDDALVTFAIGPVGESAA